MSRTVYFGIGIALGFVGFCCGVMAFMVYASTAASPSSSAGGGIAFFAVPLLVAAFGAFWCFARALRPAPKALRSDAEPQPAQSPKLAAGDTADERLAPLLRNERNQSAPKTPL
jgi:hypothetical protein